MGTNEILHQSKVGLSESHDPHTAQKPTNYGVQMSNPFYTTTHIMKSIKQAMFVLTLSYFVTIVPFIDASQGSKEETSKILPGLQRKPVKYEWEEGYVDPEDELMAQEQSPPAHDVEEFGHIPVSEVEQSKGTKKPKKTVRFAEEVQVHYLPPVKKSPNFYEDESIFSLGQSSGKKGGRWDESPDVHEGTAAPFGTWRPNEPTLEPMTRKTVYSRESPPPPKFSPSTRQQAREDPFVLKSKNFGISDEESSESFAMSSKSKLASGSRAESPGLTEMGRNLGYDESEEASFEVTAGSKKEDPYNLDVQHGGEVPAYGRVEKPARLPSYRPITSLIVPKHVFPAWINGDEFSLAFSEENLSILDQLKKETGYFKPPVEKPKLKIVGGAKTAMPVCPPDAFRNERLLIGGHFSVTYVARHVKSGLPILRKDLVITVKQHAEFDMQYRMSRMTGFVPTIYCIRTDPLDHTYYRFDVLEGGKEKLEWPTAWKEYIPETEEIHQTRISPWNRITMKRIKPRKHIRPVSVFMEYVGGGDLYDFMAKFRAPAFKYLDGLLVIQYLAEVYAIISRIHELGVLHLDIKPENFVIGDDGHLRAIDFGLSVKKEEGLRAKAQGTPRYMAPEVHLRGLIDETADYFSYGVTMYVVYERHLNFYDITNAKFSPHTPLRLQEAIRGLTHNDPEIRRKYWINLPKKLPLFARVDWNEMNKRAYATS